VEFEVFMAVIMWILAFGTATLCGFVNGYQLFGGTLQVTSKAT
jgi:hypothetical protein